MAGASLFRDTVTIEVLTVERFQLFIGDLRFFISTVWKEKKVQFDLGIGHVVILVLLVK